MAQKKLRNENTGSALGKYSNSDLLALVHSPIAWYVVTDRANGLLPLEISCKFGQLPLTQRQHDFPYQKLYDMSVNCVKSQVSLLLLKSVK